MEKERRVALNLAKRKEREALQQRAKQKREKASAMSTFVSTQPSNEQNVESTEPQHAQKEENRPMSAHVGEGKEVDQQDTPTTGSKKETQQKQEVSRSDVLDKSSTKDSNDMAIDKEFGLYPQVQKTLFPTSSIGQSSVQNVPTAISKDKGTTLPTISNSSIESTPTNQNDTSKLDTPSSNITDSNPRRNAAPAIKDSTSDTKKNDDTCPSSPLGTLDYYEVVTTSDKKSSKTTNPNDTGETSSVSKRSSSSSANNTNKKRVIKIKAMDFETQTLDIYSYHRGIAGYEPRDESSGHLLCETYPVDTNHFWDAPKLSFTVMVSFPLGDLDPESDTDDNEEVDNKVEKELTENQEQLKKDETQSHQKMLKNQRVQARKRRREEQLASIPYYNEEVEWDLSNPCTPTPLVYAGDMAVEYGLSFPQTLDLAASIQNQIDAHVRENVSYRIPISIQDDYLGGIGDESSGRQHPISRVPKILYGGHCAENLAVPSSKKHSCLNESGTNKSKGSSRNSEKVSKGNRRRSLASDAKRDSLRNSSKKRRRSNVDDLGVFGETETMKDRKRTKKSEKRFNSGLPVPKVPPGDFPVEVCMERNCDPALFYDFKTIFTPEGTFEDKTMKTTKEDVKEGESEVNENEITHMDACHICEKEGASIFCGTCPRSFHETCLPSDKENKASSWRCHRCHEEDKENESDKVSGERFVEQISPFYHSLSKFDPEFQIKLRMLSQIYEIICVLRDYDYGEIFAEPVRGVPDYRIVVDQPMDFGTIKNRLMSDFYCIRAEDDWKKQEIESTQKEEIADKGSPIDHAIWLVLKDIDLVWHNCFLYNREGKIALNNVPLL